MSTLLNAYASIDLPGLEGYTPLMAAAQNGHTEVLHRLLDGGADANYANGAGVTPLIAAIGSDNVHVVRALLDAGARPDQADAHGLTPLMVAAARGNEWIAASLMNASARAALIQRQLLQPVVRMSLRHTEGARESVARTRVNANPLAPTANEAMLMAAENGHANMLEYLLYRGADSNYANEAGVTALMTAAGEGHTRIARELIRRGARIEQQNNFGQTALQIAEIAGQAEAAHLMRHEALRSDLWHSPELRSTLSCPASGELFSAVGGPAAPYLASSGQSFARHIALEEQMNPITRGPWGDPPPVLNDRMTAVVRALVDAYDGTNLAESVRQAFVIATEPRHELGRGPSGRLERDISFETFVARSRLFLDGHGIRHPASASVATAAHGVAAVAAGVDPGRASYMRFLAPVPSVISSAVVLASVSPASTGVPMPAATPRARGPSL